MEKEKTVLIVEDDPSILQLLSIWLEKEGLKTIQTTGVYEALGAVIVEEPDLVLMDIMLPQINGYQVSRFLKEAMDIGYLKKTIPVIVFTARKAASDQEEEFLKAWSRADAQLYKPLDIKDVLETVKKFLKI